MKLEEGKTYFRNTKTGAIYNFEPLLAELNSPTMVRFVHTAPEKPAAAPKQPAAPPVKPAAPAAPLKPAAPPVKPAAPAANDPLDELMKELDGSNVVPPPPQA